MPGPFPPVIADGGGRPYPVSRGPRLYSTAEYRAVGPTAAEPSWAPAGAQTEQADREARPMLTDEPAELPPGVVYPAAVPQQRGTVYSGQPVAGEMTTAMPPQPAASENSGSLTGHILAAGWADAEPHSRRGNTKVVVVMAVVFAALIAGSLLMLFLADDMFSNLFGGLFKD